MRIIDESRIMEFIAGLKKRASTSVREDDVQKVVRRIISDVQRQGDRAVRKYTEKFDSVKPGKLAATAREISTAADRVDRKFLKALKLSAGRIRSFHRRQKEKTWQYSSDGITLGQIIRPIDRAGVYVPGGKAAYPSTVLMNVIPAQVAGVREIALCVPNPEGGINPYVAAAIQLTGITEVYKIGGAQAVAALAYGTETIRRVDKITGPGNIYVAIAKKMVFGEVGIDMVAGPSEILVIADRSADPDFIAADLLSQAEHDEMASSVLVTDSKQLAQDVDSSLKEQLKKLQRKEIAKKSLARYGAIVVARSLSRAVDIANLIAPEHLEIMTRSPKKLLAGVRNAGAVFLGKWTPEPMGDYSAGPNHTLPTGGTARFSSPLGVYDFVKRTSLLDFTREGFGRLADVVETIADIEGLEAHANTLRIRRNK